ncbi:MAG: hypothetical protein Q7R95_06530 [bacterium]|nr:hypothetical protein [bacterium]
MKEDTEKEPWSTKGLPIKSGNIEESNIDQIRRSMEELEATVPNLKQEVVELQKEIRGKEIKIIEIIGVFITLFTFISVNVNIFTNVRDIYTAVWFMLIMTVCSLIILSFLFLVINTENDFKKWIFLFLCLILLIVIIFLPIFNIKFTSRLNKDYISENLIK